MPGVSRNRGASGELSEAGGCWDRDRFCSACLRTDAFESLSPYQGFRLHVRVLPSSIFRVTGFLRLGFLLSVYRTECWFVVQVFACILLSFKRIFSTAVSLFPVTRCEEPSQSVPWALPSDHYVIFDCPGQVEVYTHSESMRQIIQRLQKQLDARVRVFVDSSLSGQSSA